MVQFSKFNYQYLARSRRQADYITGLGAHSHKRLSLSISYEADSLDEPTAFYQQVGI